MMTHTKEAPSATNEIKHCGFSYFPVVSLMNLKWLSSLDIVDDWCPQHHTVVMITTPKSDRMTQIIYIPHTWDVTNN